MSKRVFTQTFGVVGALLERDGKILLVKEAGKVDGGKWSHPAGWIDIGENPIEAAQREALEESGYEVEATALLGIYSLVREDIQQHYEGTPHALKLIFKVKLLTNTPRQLHDDVSETKWFTPEEIEAMDGDTLRDVDIKQMVRDYFAGKEAPLSILVHTVQQ